MTTAGGYIAGLLRFAKTAKSEATMMAAPDTKHRAYRLGLQAESACAWWLRLRGYQILAQRYRNRFGEIDIVAGRRGVIAFVEVKTRRGRQAALEAITAKQRRRIESASGFLAAIPTRRNIPYAST